MNKGPNDNVIIPSKDELVKVALNQYNTWHREEIQVWTNCSWEFLNYIKNWDNIKLFVKKSFLRMTAEKFEEDYKLIKSKFKNIVPNQWFVKVWDNVFAFCAPIWIKVDIFEEKNAYYIIEILKKEPKLLKQIKFFIKTFEELIQEWLTLDLYWRENLVISDDNKLYYLDSFLVFHNSFIIRDWSIKNLEFLKKLIKETESKDPPYIS